MHCHVGYPLNRAKRYPIACIIDFEVENDTNQARVWNDTGIGNEKYHDTGAWLIPVRRCRERGPGLIPGDLRKRNPLEGV